ncbi:APLF factor, partial [Bucco capensis]|nr:APLF factor [Bucco capensis]
NQEADAEAAPTVDPGDMSCSPSLTELACGSSEVQGAAAMRNSSATSRPLVSLSDDNESEESKPIQRKRELPSWMLDRDLLVQRISEPVIKGGSRMTKGQGRGESNVEALKSEVNVQQKRRLASKETIEDVDGEEQDQGKRSCLSMPVPTSQSASGFPLENTMRNMEGNGKTATKSPGSSLENNARQLHSERSKRAGQISSKENRIKAMGNKEQITGSTSQQAPWGRTSQGFGAQEGILEPDADLDDKTEVSDSTTSADAAESSKQTKRKRTPCMYGAGCYRKNPIHFQQFSHPQDEDYQEMEILPRGDSDNRPECPYGTACYRKNPQHKLEYQHSAPSGKRAVEKDGASGSEPNECDLPDSLRDDEEEECEPTDEDSDWEPSSEDKESEDVETLLQEAHRFVKTKK